MKTAFYFLCLLAVISCQKATPDCGCNGTTAEVLTEELAVFRTGSMNTINSPGYYFVCNPDFVKGKVADGDTVVITGKAHLNCFKGETLIALPQPLEVTLIRKK